MAIVCNGSTDYVTRTANLPTRDAFTLCAWVKRVSDRNSYEGYLNVTRTSALAYVAMFPSEARLYSDGAGSLTWTGEFPVGEWFYLAITHDGTNCKAYWYDSSQNLVQSVLSQSTAGWSAGDPTKIEVMSNTLYSQWVDGKACYIRLFNAALSQSAIEAEMARDYVYNTTDINTALGACTTSSFANDVSGNGRNWTLGAGLSTSDYDSDVPSGLLSSGPTYIPRMALLGVG